MFDSKSIDLVEYGWRSSSLIGSSTEDNNEVAEQLGLAWLVGFLFFSLVEMLCGRCCEI